MESSREPVKVAVVNDFPIVVSGVATMLAPYSDRVKIVRRTRGTEVRDDIDVVLYDTFASINGTGEVLRTLTGYGNACVVVFSWNTDETLVSRALAAGAAGYLPKSLRPVELVDAIEAVKEGKLVRPDAGSIRAHVTAAAASWWPGIEQGLSAREAEMIGLMVRGLSNTEIAEAAFISINSVKTYIRTAYRKMGVSTRAQAVVWGIRHGFDVDAPAD